MGCSIKSTLAMLTLSVIDPLTSCSIRWQREIMRVCLFNYSLHWWSDFSYSSCPKYTCHFAPCLFFMYFLQDNFIHFFLFCMLEEQNACQVYTICLANQTLTFLLVSNIELMIDYEKKKEVISTSTANGNEP